MKSTNRILSVLLICALAMALFLCAPACAEEGKKEWNGIVWEQDSLLGALLIKGIGSMPVDIPMPWADSASENTTVSFDSGVTDIPAGFTAGCVNMKTIMIPASLRTIGQGVLAVSGGLRDVYYEGTLEGLLAIQMFPEDRAALNGAVFHGSKIVYKENGEFEYVPMENADFGEMKVVDQGDTVTVTLSSGKVVTITYGVGDQADQIQSASYSLGEYDVNEVRYYRKDGTLERIEYKLTERGGKTGKLIKYYDETGRDCIMDYFEPTDGSGTSTGYYDKSGKLIKEVVVLAGNEKSITEYVNQGDVERIVTIIDKYGNEEYVRTYKTDGTSETAYDSQLNGYNTRVTDYINANDILTAKKIEYTDEGGAPDPDTGKMVSMQVVNVDETGKPTSMDNYYKDGTTAHTQYIMGDYRTTFYDVNGKKTYDITVLSGNQQYRQNYAEDGQTVTDIHIEWLSSGQEGHTADITYNADRSYTRVDHYSGGQTLVRYYDKYGNEVNEHGSPVVN